MTSSLIRRLALALLIIALLVGGIWWAKRPKPIAVVVVEIDQGKVDQALGHHGRAH